MAVGGTLPARGRGWHDLRGQLNPLPVTNLEGGIVPQRALGSRRQAKLRGQLPGSPRDARELVFGNRVRPAQNIYGLGLHAVEVDEPHPERAVGLEQRREMRRVEPDGVSFDFPHDSAHALVAPSDGAR